MGTLVTRVWHVRNCRPSRAGSRAACYPSFALPGSLWPVLIKRRSDLPNIELRLALAAVLLMAAIDNLLNSGMILPLVLVIGGMSAPAPLGVPPLKRHPDRSK